MGWSIVTTKSSVAPEPNTKQASPLPFWLPEVLERILIPVAPILAVEGIDIETVPVDRLDDWS